MKKITLLGYLFGIILTASLQAQDFTNLDFEAAKIIFLLDSYAIAITNALPGWSAFVGTYQLSAINYDVGAAGPPQLFGSNYAIDGNFDVLLGGVSSISQTGLVPGDAESLTFAWIGFGGGSILPVVSLGDQTLSYTAISGGTNPYGSSYIVYGANVSAFAEETETLTFSAPTGSGFLDDIVFSPGTIPEPPTASLLLLGSGILFYVRRTHKMRGLI
jgi:PEP-CTERM motif